jgi:hypothetical protein
LSQFQETSMAEGSGFGVWEFVAFCSAKVRYFRGAKGDFVAAHPTERLVIMR